MGFIIATLIVLVVIASVVAQDFSVFSWAYWQEGGTSTSRSEVVRNLGLLGAAVIGLGVGSWRAYTAYHQTQASRRQAEAATEQARVANEQARIAQQGQITNLFSTAVEHLGSEQLPVRLGGIYALWRLIKDSPDRVISVIDILCAFVRHPPHEPAQGPDPSASEDGQASAEKAKKPGSTNKIRPDVQTVLDRIGTKKAVYRALLPAGYRLDLTGANLAGARLTDADLRYADLSGANLWGANLAVADLAGAVLERANLTRANLYRANLTNTNLVLANLTHANLLSANLTGANLLSAYLTVADLTNAIVTQEQLDSACISKGGRPPTLPEGLKPPRGVARPWIR